MPARDGDARSLALTRQARPQESDVPAEAVASTPRGQMLRRGLETPKQTSGSGPSFGKEDSLPHARQDRQASSVSRPLEGRRRPKKPGPSLLQVASPVGRGAPVCLRLPVFPGRLTGLLSRSPPTDTRPQARAYWAHDTWGESLGIARGFFAGRAFFDRRKTVIFDNLATFAPGGSQRLICGAGADLICRGIVA